MREWADLEYAEIALALATSEGNARQLVFSARSGLVESRAGRNESCDAIRLQLAAADGRRLRNRRVRSHLETCEACRTFSSETKDRRRSAAAAFLPWVAAPGILSAGGAAGGVTGGSAVLGGLAKGVAVAAIVTGSVGTAELAVKEADPPKADRADVVEVAGRMPEREPDAVSDTPKATAAAPAARVTGSPSATAAVLTADAPAETVTSDPPVGRERGHREERERAARTDQRPPPDGGTSSRPAASHDRPDPAPPDGGGGDGDPRHHSASTHTDFLRAPSGVHTGG
jgi:hypothetical protein